MADDGPLVRSLVSFLILHAPEVVHVPIPKELTVPPREPLPNLIAPATPTQASSVPGTPNFRGKQATASHQRAASSVGTPLSKNHLMLGGPRPQGPSTALGTPVRNGGHFTILSPPASPSHSTPPVLSSTPPEETADLGPFVLHLLRPH